MRARDAGAEGPCRVAVRFEHTRRSGRAGRQERSAALPSGERVAALLGVLAGCLEGTLGNYPRQELFSTVPRRSIHAGHRADKFVTRSRVHAAWFVSRLGRSGFCFVRTLLQDAGRLPKHTATNSAFTTAYKCWRIDFVHQRGTLCLRGTRRGRRPWPEETGFAIENRDSLEGRAQAAAPPLFSCLRTSWPSRFR